MSIVWDYVVFTICALKYYGFNGVLSNVRYSCLTVWQFWLTTYDDDNEWLPHQAESHFFVCSVHFGKLISLCAKLQPELEKKCSASLGGEAPRPPSPGAVPLDPWGHIPQNPDPPTNNFWIRHCKYYLMIICDIKQTVSYTVFYLKPLVLDKLKIWERSALRGLI